MANRTSATGRTSGSDNLFDRDSRDDLGTELSRSVRDVRRRSDGEHP